MKTRKYMLLAAVAMFLIMAPGCRKHQPHEQVDHAVHEEHGHGIEPEESAVPAEVRLSPASAAIAGVKTEVVEYRDLSLPVRAAGTVAFNDKRRASVTSRIAGRVEELKVYPGEKVEAGQKLLSLFSSEFLSVQGEYLQIAERMKKLEEAKDAAGFSVASRMLDSAVGKLKLMGLEEDTIRSLRESRTPLLLLPVSTLFEGTVIESRVVLGTYVEAGSGLFDIADLRTLWVQADIYEKVLRFMKPGLEAEVRVEAYPGEVFRGRLTLISSVLDRETRTVRVRVEVANPGLRLKPWMFADLTIFMEAGQKVLVVPEKAVREVEGKKVVFVASSGNVFEAREVKTGSMFPGFIEIVEGLKEGESVVTEGSFGLKSEMLKKTIVGDHKHD